MIALSAWAQSGPWIANISASRINNFHWEDAPTPFTSSFLISLSMVLRKALMVSSLTENVLYIMLFFLPFMASIRQVCRLFILHSLLDLFIYWQRLNGIPNPLVSSIIPLTSAFKF